jgi:hypothetical protein
MNIDHNTKALPSSTLQRKLCTMSASARPKRPNRSLQNSVLRALDKTTEKAREEELTTALKSWVDKSASGVRSPHLLVHIPQKTYDIGPLLKTRGLNKRDARDIKILKKVCGELNFKVLYASVEKALGCVARGGFEDDDYYDDDYSGYERQENLRPKIYPEYDVRLDQLVLERVVELDGSACGNRVPVRDSELVQESPFTYESARIRTDFEDNYVTTNDLLLHQ